MGTRRKEEETRFILENAPSMTKKTLAKKFEETFGKQITISSVPYCHKKLAFDSRHNARLAISKRNTSSNLHEYRCPECGKWHLTTRENLPASRWKKEVEKRHSYGKGKGTTKKEKALDYSKSGNA